MNGLPEKAPFLCRWHVRHRWSGFYEHPVIHSGEYPWEKWQHLCKGVQKKCTACGRVHRKWGKRNDVGPWVVDFPNMPHRVTGEEVDEAFIRLFRNTN